MSRPDDINALLNGLIERNHLVVVTGEYNPEAIGLNQKADVGFATGIAGIEVAREAASIKFLDDNFREILLFSYEK